MQLRYYDMILTAEKLKERLFYNPETGLFIYRYNINTMKAGDTAGTTNTNGHRQISINGKYYLAHNLAWFYMTGEFPIDFIIDHKDRNYDNNKWLNLRKANLSMNQGNRKINENNTSGYKGVTFHKSKGTYAAQIGINGRRVHLGYRKTPQEAFELYKKAALEFFGEFYNER